MQIQGGCHCGAIGYEARINPDYVIICHCTDCQTSSGAPYRANVPVLAFCGNCGSALYSHREDNPPFYNLRLGAIRQRAELTPRGQYWCDSAMPWAMDISRIPRSPDGRPIADPAGA